VFQVKKQEWKGNGKKSKNNGAMDLNQPWHDSRVIIAPQFTFKQQQTRENPEI